MCVQLCSGCDERIFSAVSIVYWYRVCCVCVATTILSFRTHHLVYSRRSVHNLIEVFHADAVDHLRVGDAILGVTAHLPAQFSGIVVRRPAV